MAATPCRATTRPKCNTVAGLPMAPGSTSEIITAHQEALLSTCWGQTLGLQRTRE